MKYECEDSNNDEIENENTEMTLPTSWTTEFKPFTEIYGPTVPIPDKPLDVFQLFFTDELLMNPIGTNSRSWVMNKHK